MAFPRCTHKQTRDEQGRDAFPLMPDEGLLSQCCFRPVHSAARSGWTSVSLKAQSGEATMTMLAPEGSRLEFDHLFLQYPYGSRHRLGSARVRPWEVSCTFRTCICACNTCTAQLTAAGPLSAQEPSQVEAQMRLAAGNSLCFVAAVVLGRRCADCCPLKA